MKKLILTALVLANVIPSFAQDPAKNLEAQEHYKKGEYKESALIYEEMLNDFSSIKDKNKANIVIKYTQSLSWWLAKDKSIEFNRTDEIVKPSKFIAKITDPLFPNLEQKQILELYVNIVLSEVDRLETTAGASISTLEEKIKILDAGIIALPVYSLYNQRGFAYEGLRKDKKAMADYIMALEKYKSADNKKKDVYIGYTYFRLASLVRFRFLDDYSTNQLKDMNEALEYINEGKQTTKSTYDNLTEGNKKVYKSVYDDVYNSLDGLELDIIINHPEKQEEAISRIAEKVNQNPNDYTYRVVYANLLESRDINKAIEQYEKAIEIDSNKLNAYYNLGAIYINQAATLYQKSVNATDAEYSELEKQIDELYKKAYPMFVKAHEIQPDDKEILSQLKSITAQLNMTEEYQIYRDKYNELK